MLANSNAKARFARAQLAMAAQACNALQSPSVANQIVLHIKVQLARVGNVIATLAFDVAHVEGEGGGFQKSKSGDLLRSRS